MTEYITPTTWEQCAAHVEAGGVVEIEDAPGVWINDRAAATTYRGRCGTPDDGWAPRRLVPGESAPAPESSTGIGEGEAVRAYYRPTAERLRAISEVMTAERLRAISEVMTAERLRDEAAAPAAGDDLRERIARAIYEEEHDGPWKNANHPDWVRSLRSADAVLAVLPTPAPPVPPWPGDENDDTARLSPDQGDRIVNACCRMLGCEPADIDGDAALEEILTEAVERCADLHGQDRWEDDCHGCGFRVGDHTTDGRCPAPAAPVPPWPGAVLSGLTDEDGVPTWLAQAGQVPGEQVRQWRGDEWLIRGYLSPWNWVEVRAPRAVPVPETERVPWWEAVGRVVPDVGTIREVGMSGDQAWVRCGDYDPDGVAPDGTVEVLRRDGEQ